MEKTPLSDAPKMELPTIVFATHNLNKVEELRQMLEGYYRVQSLTDIGCHEPIVKPFLSLLHTVHTVHRSPVHSQNHTSNLVRKSKTRNGRIHQMV